MIGRGMVVNLEAIGLMVLSAFILICLSKASMNEISTGRLKVKSNVIVLISYINLAYSC